MLHRYGRIAQPGERQHRPMDGPHPWRPGNSTSKMPPPCRLIRDGKQQHVVEVLDTVDAGTSLLLNAQPRADFTAETTRATVVETLNVTGCPRSSCSIATVGLWDGLGGAISPRPLCASGSVWASKPRCCPRDDPDPIVLSSGTIAPTSRNACGFSARPTWTRSRTVTARYQQHYNEERPHQSVVCRNSTATRRICGARHEQELPSQLPTLVDPDRWLTTLRWAAICAKGWAGIRV